jgi:hypothetical protein
VDPKRLLDEMVEYKKQVSKAKKEGLPKPYISEYVGKCILDIAERLSRKPNFAGYSYREDMVGSAIENVLTYIDNFNPKKSKNVFAYFTQIIYWAFLRKIAFEKKQQVIRYKAIQNSPMFQELSQQTGDDSRYANPYVKFLRDNMNDVVTDFEDKKKAKKEKLKKKNNLEKLL